ncbi:MAG: hypothetical protein ACTSXN_08140, partial [Promethearchaeota archaeon]
NYNKSDSRLDNLWLFSKREHSGMRATLYNCLEILIKLNQIYFVQGMYLFNNKIDCKILNSVQKK